MSNYSIGGYKIAIRARSSKTLVVEGKDDRSLLQRIFLEEISGISVGDQVRVDASEIVKDPILSGMGARDRVAKIIEFCRPPNGKLKGLRDREWDFFCTDNLSEIVGGVLDEDIFITRGHSIENYFFDINLCCDFLKRKFSSAINKDFLVAVHDCFGEMIDFSFAYSVACKRLNIIERMERVLSPIHVERRDALVLAEGFKAAMISRGIAREDVEMFFREFASINEHASMRQATPQSRRWWSHGHLGEDALWACLGWVAMQHGVGETDAESICHGHKDEKRQGSAHMMALNFSGEYFPLDRIIEWAVE